MVTKTISINSDKVELFVERLIPGGYGLAKLNGLRIFIPYAAPEEQIKAKIVLRKKDYAVAKIEDIVIPSPFRVTPACVYYSRCGGCQFQHLSYPSQLVIKKLFVNDALQRIGKIFVPVDNISFRSSEWRYRNKTQYPVAGKERVKIGFYQSGTHHLINISKCLLHPENFDQLRNTVIDVLRRTGEVPYDEKTHRGNIRHLIFRQGYGGEILIVVVTRTNQLKPQLVKELADFPSVMGILQNINPERTNRILGSKMVPLWGKTHLEMRVMGKKFRVSAGSFFQVNIPQAEELCRKVIKAIEPSGTELVVDLFSGVGMLSLILAEKVSQVKGIEIDPTAVEDAISNSENMGFKNVEFINGKVERVFQSITAADVVILDPPRKGCPPETLLHIGKINPGIVIYVSCNPTTLARDLKILEEQGYSCEQVEPLDMFPQTAHVEVVAKLTRK